MESFKRRIYNSPKGMLQDVRWTMRNRKRVREAMNGTAVSFPFRERLMLAVTAVNGCRYCSYYHAKEAVKAGLPDDELQKMLVGVVDDAPADELPALLYAQHWAEMDGVVETAVKQQFIQIYGAERAQAIETVLSMIRQGNLWGNTLDYLIYRLTFGHRGRTEYDH
jgi:AhpD family alkylhydroperoxidase